jgi:predicted adenylyl cyclase CyaB
LIEEEVKLAFENVEAARRAVLHAGGRLVISRRLLDDRLYDTPAQDLRRAAHALRIRRDGDHGYLTFKGPPTPGPTKAREEIEVRVENATITESILFSLGYQRTFHSQKYREEYAIGEGHLAIDDAPIGTYVEIEATAPEIARISALLGKTPKDYVLDSYAMLYLNWCEARGIPPTEMTFPNR